MYCRRWMHPRHPYRDPPNFTQLAITYPEFRAISTTNLAGKVKIDFKSEKTLRVLAKTLLKDTFDLNVEIPPSKLVPSISLRLNYVLWLEDLIKYAGVEDLSRASGIDIGTGAVCIYPLLLAKLYRINMIGTELDSVSHKSAVNNVDRNSLGDLIQVVRVNDGTYIKDAISNDASYTFTMCNPPFFDTLEEMHLKAKRSDNCPPPKNAPTGDSVELSVEGGETAFIQNLVDDSVIIGARIKLYTTMFGRKSTLSYLEHEMHRRNILNYTWTEFFQGRTQRWGFVWTFLPEDCLNLKKAPVVRRVTPPEVLKKVQNAPMGMVFTPTPTILTVEHFIKALKEELKLRKLDYEDLEINDPKINGWACQVVAKESTWLHDRKRRRQAMMKNSSPKRHCLDISTNSGKTLDEPCLNQGTKANPDANSSIEEKLNSDSTANEVQKSFSDPSGSRGAGSNSDPSVIKVDKSNANPPYLTCQIIIAEVITQDTGLRKFRMSMIYVDGVAGREGMGNLRQYLINKLNVRRYSDEPKSKSKRKRRKKTPANNIARDEN